ncbi:MAG: amino acid permease [Deltaproteobacteria bacterium]|nr:amino acid permease [Deltaproteobacteria bacterium]
MRIKTPALSSLGALAFSIGTSLGWGAMVVISDTYLMKAGPMGSVLGLIAGAMIMLIISRNYAYMIHHFPKAGGAYTYSKETFGHDHAFLTAWFLILTYFTVLWANAMSIPLFAQYFFGGIFQFGYLYSLFGYDIYLGEVLVFTAVITLAAFLMLQKKSIIHWLMIGLVGIFVLGLAVVFGGTFLPHDCSLAPAYVPAPSPLLQIVGITIFSPWAFIGFESISHGAEEFSFSRKRVFRIFVISVIFTTTLYIFITLLSITAYPPEYSSWFEYIRDLKNLEGVAKIPAFYAANHYMGSFGIGVLTVSLLALVITSLFGNIAALSRLFYALGKNRILPAQFAEVNKEEVPDKAIFLIVCMSLFVPFLGRSAISWIVDVATLGSVFIYAFVSAATIKLAKAKQNKLEMWTGIIGSVIMIVFFIDIIMPNLISHESMATETYFLFIIWPILGFAFFGDILRRDKVRKFGKSFIVWIAMLFFVLLTSLVWIRKSMSDYHNMVINNINEYYNTVAHTPVLNQQFLAQQMDLLRDTQFRTVVIAGVMFTFSFIILLINYYYMNKRNREIELIANTDDLTRLKNMNAYLFQIHEIDDYIEDELMHEFAIVVVDINDLKYINDTYGHKAGDEHIQSAGVMLQELFPHSLNLIFRTGGDEFVVILTGHDYEERHKIMDILHKRAENNIGTRHVILAAGISDYRLGEDQNTREVFRRADDRMYQRKLELKKRKPEKSAGILPASSNTPGNAVPCVS